MNMNNFQLKSAAQEKFPANSIQANSQALASISNSSLISLFSNQDSLQYPFLSVIGNNHSFDLSLYNISIKNSQEFTLLNASGVSNITTDLIVIENSTIGNLFTINLNTSTINNPTMDYYMRRINITNSQKRWNSTVNVTAFEDKSKSYIRWHFEDSFIFNNKFTKSNSSLCFFNINGLDLAFSNTHMANNSWSGAHIIDINVTTGSLFLEKSSFNC